MNQIQSLANLTKNIKQLGLTGMAESLEERQKQALTNQMPYYDFLSLLMEDEMLVRENRRYQRRLKMANLQGFKTMENFDISKLAPEIKTLILELAACRFVAEKFPALIVGPCGTGKSHLAQAIGFCAIKHGCDVIYSNQSQLSEKLQSAKAIGTFNKVLKKLSNVPLLIIDDFALSPLKQIEEENLHGLITNRYEHTSTLVTSNLAVNEWHQAFQNKLLASAIIDRLQHNSYILTLEGESYRRPKMTISKNIKEKKMNTKS